MPEFKTIISESDYQVILNVKKLREDKGISQRQLSDLMGLSKSFVGKVEALGQPEKYSIRHLSLIAKALQLESYSEILPIKIPENDMIEITYTKISKIHSSGITGKQLEDKVINIRSVSSANS